jgi:hypothetical protein
MLTVIDVPYSDGPAQSGASDFFKLQPETAAAAISAASVVESECFI